MMWPLLETARKFAFPTEQELRHSENLSFLAEADRHSVVDPGDEYLISLTLDSAPVGAVYQVSINRRIRAPYLYDWVLLDQWGEEIGPFLGRSAKGYYEFKVARPCNGANVTLRLRRKAKADD